MRKGKTMNLWSGVKYTKFSYRLGKVETYLESITLLSADYKKVALSFNGDTRLQNGLFNVPGYKRGNLR